MKPIRKYVPMPAPAPTSAAGITRISRPAYTVAIIVTTPTATVTGLKPACPVSSEPKLTESPTPKNGRICDRKMSTAMPFMIPDTTGKGMYLINLPPPTAPSTIWNIPASSMVAATISRIASAVLTPRLANSGSLAKRAINAVMTTDIAAVGPVICAGVPPNTLARKPAMIKP